MSCLPESGGCEQPRIRPFIAYLNQIEGSLFCHVACPDRVCRNSRQPDAVYSDSSSGGQLVIERTTIVWPEDYVARHQNDHFIADALCQELGELAEDLPLSILLEPASRMSRGEMSTFASEISSFTRANINTVLAGRAVGSGEAGRRWSCFLDPDGRANFGWPARGLVVQWTQPEEMVSPDNLPPKLADKIQSLFLETVEKFSSYPHARGVLLLDAYGAIRYTGDWWWARAFKTVRVPEEIAEIWLVTYDWITDFEQDWIVERLHPSREGTV